MDSWHGQHAPGERIPVGLVSILVKVERIDAHMMATLGAHEQRIGRMERHLDSIARGLPRKVDWATALKLAATAVLFAAAATGIITWPEAASYSAGLHGAR